MEQSPPAARAHLEPPLLAVITNALIASTYFYLKLACSSWGIHPPAPDLGLRLCHGWLMSAMSHCSCDMLWIISDITYDMGSVC